MRWLEMTLMPHGFPVAFEAGGRGAGGGKAADKRLAWGGVGWGLAGEGSLDGCRA